MIEHGGIRLASGMGLREESGCLYENISKCLVVNSPCTNSNNCYAIICRLCEEQLDLENEIVDIIKNPTSKYIGTSARTLHARSREHIDLFNAKSANSVLYKHVTHKHIEDVNSEAQTLFRMIQLSSHRTNLNRMAMEAILIENSEKETLLNGKGAWGRTKIIRMQVTQNRV